MSFRDYLPRPFRRRDDTETGIKGPSSWMAMTTEPDPRHDDFDKATVDVGHLRAADVDRARMRGVSLDPEASPTGGHVVTEEQVRQDLGLPRTEAAAGQGLTLEQLDQAEHWYVERDQPVPSWVHERRAELLAAEAEDASSLRARPRRIDMDASLNRARATRQAFDAVHVDFEDRVAALDNSIAETASRIAEATDHTHLWNRPDPDGRWNWKCACGAVKCDLPRCIRARHSIPPHHVRS